MRERTVHALDPVLRFAADAAHVQIGRAFAAVVDERRHRVERVEHVVPHHARTRCVVDEHANAAAGRRARLQHRLTGTRTERVGRFIALDDATAIALVGEHGRGGVRRSCRKHVVAARHTQTKYGHVNAKQHGRSFHLLFVTAPSRPEPNGAL